MKSGIKALHYMFCAIILRSQFLEDYLTLDFLTVYLKTFSLE